MVGGGGAGALGYIRDRKVRMGPNFSPPKSPIRPMLFLTSQKVTQKKFLFSHIKNKLTLRMKLMQLFDIKLRTLWYGLIFALKKKGPK